MIILEGADRSGKTTLGKKLSEKLGLRYVHPGGRPKTENERLYNLSEQFLCAHIRHNPMIYDRVTCISDPIYRKDLMNPLAKVFRDAMMNIPYTFLIYCRPPDAELAKILDTKVTEHDTEEHLLSVKENWKSIVDDYDSTLLDLSHAVYDFTTDQIEPLIKLIKERIWNT